MRDHSGIEGEILWRPCDSAAPVLCSEKEPQLITTGTEAKAG
jgi:hypothetical protein